MAWLKLVFLKLPVRFCYLSGTEKHLIIKVLLGLVLARLAVIALPFRMISPFLGRLMGKTPTWCTQEEKDRSQQVAEAIHKVSRYVPINCTCLTRAITGNMILGMEDIPNTLYLGVKRSMRSKLTAHAWLRCGDVYLTGEQEKEEYVTVATFAKFKKPS